MRLYAASFPQTGDITRTDISVDTENRKRIVRRIMKRQCALGAAQRPSAKACIPLLIRSVSDL